VLKLALISALAFEISQRQSAQDRVVLSRWNAIIVCSDHYEVLVMWHPGAKIRFAGSTQFVLRKFYRNFDRMIFASFKLST
jgi:hypothetical protein